MSAYTNPPRIQLANVAEIYARSAANINSSINNYIKGEQAKVAQAKKNITESQKRIAEFGTEVSDAQEGTLFGSVAQSASDMTSAYSELETARLRGEISEADYAATRAQLFNKVSQLKEYNSSWDEFGKNLQEVGDNISGYQEGEAAMSINAFEARNKGEFNVQVKGGQWTSQYKDSNGVMQTYDPKLLGTVEATMINERFEPNEAVKSATTLLESQKIDIQGSETSKYDLKSGEGTGGTKISGGQKYKENLQTDDQKIDFLKTNPASEISQMDMSDAGSHIVDNKIRTGVKLEEDKLFTNMLNDFKFDDNDAKNKVIKSQIINAVKNGGYSRYIEVNGERFDTQAFAIEYAKTDLATSAVNSLKPLEEAAVDRTIDTTTNAADRARTASDKETIDLTKQTYEKLFTATYKAEAAGGDTKALGNLLIGVDIPGIGEVAPDLTEEGIVYNAKDNTLELPIIKGDEIEMRTIDLKDEGEEKIVNAILKRRGVKNILKATASLPGIISELDPNNERFMDENPNPEDFN